jgi:hypothetical protein
VFSLVCKAWTNPARDHLFASLAIFDDNLEEIKAANIISTYSPFLRDLSLACFNNHRKFWQDVILFLADSRTPRLRSLALVYLTWQSLSPNQRSAFLRRFESIVSLELRLCKQDTLNDIPTIICSFPHLRQIILGSSLHRCALPGRSPSSPELRLPERLSTLRVRYVCQDYRLVLEWLCSIPERLLIHTLHLSMSWLAPQDLDTVNMFLKALGPSLEVFGCHSESMFIPSAPTVELF